MSVMILAAGVDILQTWASPWCPCEVGTSPPHLRGAGRLLKTAPDPRGGLLPYRMQHRQKFAHLLKSVVKVSQGSPWSFRQFLLQTIPMILSLPSQDFWKKFKIFFFRFFSLQSTSILVLPRFGVLGGSRITFGDPWEPFRRIRTAPSSGKIFHLLIWTCTNMYEYGNW